MRVTEFLGSPPEIRKTLDQITAIASLHTSLQQVLTGRGAVPADDSILKILFLGRQHMAKNTPAPSPEWTRAPSRLRSDWEIECRHQDQRIRYTENVTSSRSLNKSARMPRSVAQGGGRAAAPA